MSIKSRLRKETKIKRKELSFNKDIHKSIFNIFINSDIYKTSSIILAYASLNDEISTDCIIKNALYDDKIVALPYCINNDGLMDFYIIKSFSDLKIGSFGVREPDLTKCEKLCKYDNSIILVPGLCFDNNGYRLGYGKGYYDRFLEKHSLKSVGLCYNDLLIENIPHDKFDLPVDFIITEKNIYNINGGKNG